MKTNIVFLILLLGFLIFGCAVKNEVKTDINYDKENNTQINSETGKINISQTKEVTKMTLSISSSAFKNNEYIPKKYSCMGENINPPISISGVPKEAKSLVLIVDDPDAPSGDWVHWVLFNIYPKNREIEEGESPIEAAFGKNDAGRTMYDGPCPPSGTHRYFFKLYALDTTLSLTQGAKKSQVLEAAKGHIIEQAEMIGLFRK